VLETGETIFEKLAMYSQKAARSGCTGLYGGSSDSVRWCTRQCPVRQAVSAELAALGTSTTVYDYNSPDCPVVHRSVR
jgi:hypothetical protein